MRVSHSSVALCVLCALRVLCVKFFFAKAPNGGANGRLSPEDRTLRILLRRPAKRQRNCVRARLQSRRAPQSQQNAPQRSPHRLPYRRRQKRRRPRNGRLRRRFQSQESPSENQSRQASPQAGLASPNQIESALRRFSPRPPRQAFRRPADQRTIQSARRLLTTWFTKISWDASGSNRLHSAKRAPPPASPPHRKAYPRTSSSSDFPFL